MHYKHNQIFTDHDIPEDAVRIEFAVRPVSWLQVAEMLDPQTARAAPVGAH
jgi:hypothetical protein